MQWVGGRGVSSGHAGGWELQATGEHDGGAPYLCKCRHCVSGAEGGGTARNEQGRWGAG